MTSNVIFIHPDGADPSHFGAARFESVGPDGRLNWDTAPESAVYLGHLDDAIVATSNAGAVVHAYGIKAVAPSFGFDENGDEYISLAGLQGQNVDGSESDFTILEEAAAAGRPTAIINSGFIAEPGTGVFFADAVSRGDREGITAQLFFDAESDGTLAEDAQPRAKYNVVLGAGEQDYLPEGVTGVFGEGTRTDGLNLVEIAEDLGYTVVYNQDQLDALDPSTELVLGMFAADDNFNEFPEGFLIENGFVDADGELVTYGQPVADAPNPDGLVLDTDGDGFTNPPTVGDMLEATLALDLFANEGDDDGEGFFIVLEEEGTDNFGNTNNARGAIDATLHADQAIGVAKDFVENVQSNTFVVTAADSAGGSLEVDDVSGETVGTLTTQRQLDEAGENSGVTVPFDGTTGSDTAPFVAAPAANGNVYEFGVAWAGLPDFAGSIVTKAWGEGADRLGSTIDNTGIYRLMYESLFDISLAAPEGVPDDLAPREAPEPTSEVGNVIFFHPDGTSPSHWAAARFASEGPDGRLNWDEMSDASVYLGHMDDRIVGTSNGGAVTHAYGVKPFAGSFGFDAPVDEGGEEIVSLSGKPDTIMQEAQAAGKAIGIINSGFIAEPGTGAFLADVDNRGNTEEITAEILDQRPDVILGAGETDYLPVGTIGVFGEEGTREDGRNLIEEAEAAGYTVVFTREELLAVNSDETDKLLGIFGAEDTYNDFFEDELRRDGFVDENGDLILYGQPPLNPNPPTIAEMVEVALPILDADPDGFFLVMEEEATDNFGNDNNAAGTIEAAIRADEALGVAMDFVDNTDPNTLIITAADSDAGGLEVDDVPIGAGTFGLTEPESDDTIRVQAETQAFGPGADGVLVQLDDTDGSNDVPGFSTDVFEPFTTGAPDADGDVFDFGVAWATRSDVAGGIVSKTYGLNADLLPDTTDNTDIYRVMYETLFGVAPEVAAAIGDFDLEVGDFSIGFDPARVSDDASGFFVADTITFNAPLFDVGNPGVLSAEGDTLLLDAADLLVSPELAGVLGNDALIGADVGDARIDAELSGESEFTVESGVTSVALDTALLESAAGLTLVGADSDAEPVNEDFQVGFAIVDETDFTFTTEGGFAPVGGSIEHSGSVFFDLATPALDFEGEGLSAGTVITDQFSGLTVTTDGLAAMLFDSANPTGGDGDLGSDTAGLVLILSEDGNSDNPDDNAGGGTLEFTWDELVAIDSVGFLDTEEPGSIDLYGADGVSLGSLDIVMTGNGQAGFVEIDQTDVSKLVVNLGGSGAVTEITFA
ncbi:MAG: alkaline phosphatase [Cyanobacteria bacterium P01_H01_bin.162]